MKPNKIHLKASINKVIFMAMSEMMADSYLNTRELVGFDSTLLNKLRNLKPSIERSLKADVNYLETGGIGVIELYHEITNVFEHILVAAQKGDAGYFEKMIKILKAYQDGDVEVYESMEEVLAENRRKEVANG